LRGLIFRRVGTEKLGNRLAPNNPRPILPRVPVLPATSTRKDGNEQNRVDEDVDADDEREDDGNDGLDDGDGKIQNRYADTRTR